MVQIVGRSLRSQEADDRALSKKFSDAIGKGFTEYNKYTQGQALDAQLKKGGFDPSGMSPENKQKMFETYLQEHKTGHEYGRMGELEQQKSGVKNEQNKVAIDFANKMTGLNIPDNTPPDIVKSIVTNEFKRIGQEKAAEPFLQKIYGSGQNQENGPQDFSTQGQQKTRFPGFLEKNGGQQESPEVNVNIQQPEQRPQRSSSEIPSAEPKVSSTQNKRTLDPKVYQMAEIPDELIARIPDINRRNLVQKQKDSAITQINEEKKRNAEENKEQKLDKREQRKEDIKFHEESSKYDEELLTQKKSAQKQLNSIEDAEKAIASGNVKPTSTANIFKNYFGKIGEKISNALIKKDEAVLQSLVPEFLEGRKELFGVRLSDADLKLLQDKLPDMSKNAEANKAVLKVMKKYSKLSLLRYDIGAKIKEENKGLRPLGYADKIEKRFDEMVKPVKIRNPNTGRVIDIPAYEASDYINDGGELVDE